MASRFVTNSTLLAFTFAAALAVGSVTGGSAMSDADILRMQSAKFPAPAGCAIVTNWEDGSLLAHCDGGTWKAHGPDDSDTWQDFHGPIRPAWQAKADALSS